MTMSSPPQASSKITYWDKVISFFILSLSLIILPEFLLNEGTIQEILTQLGRTLLIVLILLLSIQRFAQTSFLEEVKKDVFEAVLKKIFPESVYNILKAQILEFVFIRRDFDVTLTIEPYEQEKGLVKVNVFVSYKVKNLSRTKKYYPITTYYDSFYKAEIKYIKINGVEIQDLKNYIKPNRTLSLVFQKEHEIEGEGEAEIEISAYQVMSEKAIFPWSSIYPSEDLTLRVFIKGNLKLKLEVDPTHPIPEDRFRKKEYEDYYEGRIEEGLLPYQGIEVRWSPMNRCTEQSQEPQ